MILASQKSTNLFKVQIDEDNIDLDTIMTGIGRIRDRQITRDFANHVSEKIEEESAGVNLHRQFSEIFGNCSAEHFFG